MRRFNPKITLYKDSNGNYTDVEYTVFGMQEQLEVVSVNQEQIETYANGDVPGIKATITLKKSGPGRPFSFSGTFIIDPTLTLDSNRPFLDIGIYVEDPVTHETDRKGGGIIRSSDYDDF